MEWTVAVAVGVVRVLATFLPKSCPLHIKWPNDILIEGRKVCGILAETRSDYPGAILAGIGVNVLHQSNDFPPELKEIATSLAQWTPSPPNREDLFTRLIEALDQIAQELESGEFQSIEREWQNASASIGKPIKIQVGKDEIQGTLIRLTLKEGLTLQLENGQEQTFRSEHTILSE
jgi:BirA family biotin operon repressor/biotin-[acetyl-CoA-carboxylase] ligase